ncbi:hypothetical protein G4B88_007033 [Cannabis sativa]|uniref:Wall-associated receptor kinase galacturonan-binding domain-containing protein n=1 Tax=Cannabis sativa TaxID=3483 RepID=A0A7J6FQZ6_CANSA|nr:hypothetical protein G4B88_007033 [Cannabis sativa]
MEGVDDVILKMMIIITIMLTIFHNTTTTTASYYSNSSSCGNIHNITQPFHLITNTDKCSPESGIIYCVVCMNNTTLLLTSYQYPYNFTVVGINYSSYTIRVVYTNLHNNNHDCSSIPNQYDMNLLSTDSGLEIVEGLFRTDITTEIVTRIGEDGLFRWRKFKTYPISEYIIFLICENKVYNNPLYIDPSPCINSSTFGFGSGSGFVYVVYASGFKYSDLGNSCRILRSALVSVRTDEEKKRLNTSYKDIHHKLTYGFHLSFLITAVDSDPVSCYIDKKSNNKVACDDYDCSQRRGTLQLILCSKDY